MKFNNPFNSFKERLVGTERAKQERAATSRFDAFHFLAKRRAMGEMVTLPSMLEGDARRLHIRATLREDHRQRIHRHQDQADAKFKKLAGSIYSYFRGTCLLFHRDMAGEDAWMPTVLALGDVHPENFGVMPSTDNTPIFGVNDFDEAYYAPFTWDLKRGAVGFMVAALEQGVSKRRRKKIVRHFVRGYLKGIESFAQQQSESDVQVRIDNSPPLLRELLEDAYRDREEWLSKYLDAKRERFVASRKIVPLRHRLQEFAKVMARYRDENELELPGRAGTLTVKDVAERKHSGTASLGLSRYYVLLEGPHGDGTDDLILELKQARRSALAGLAPPSQYQDDGEADRVVNAQAVHLVGGDPFYGKVDVDGVSHLVRERSPFKKEIELSGLSKQDWKVYAACCGHSLSQAHALADEGGAVQDDVEPMILEAVGNQELFVDDVVRFGCRVTHRLQRDHKLFIKDWKLGAFKQIDRYFE